MHHFTYDYCHKEYSILTHSFIIHKIDDSSSDTAQESSSQPGEVSASSVVGVVGEEGAEEAGDVLDQRDDSQVGGVHMDTVLIIRLHQSVKKCILN